MSMLDIVNPQENASQNKVMGVVTAIVTDNQDPEGLGRVKVIFPWRGEERQSYWARVATFMAGPERGSFFLPEVHDEVLVAFDRGDMDYPYVIGSLWNSDDLPPTDNSDGKNNLRKITSRSGHEIILNDDSEGQAARVEIHSAAGHSIVLDDAAGGEKIEIVDQSGSNKISIDSAQNAITLESGMQLNLKADMVEIEGTNSLTLKSSAMLTLEGMPVSIN